MEQQIVPLIFSNPPQSLCLFLPSSHSIISSRYFRYCCNSPFIHRRLILQTRTSNGSSFCSRKNFTQTSTFYAFISLLPPSHPLIAEFLEHFMILQETMEGNVLHNCFLYTLSSFRRHTCLTYESNFTTSTLHRPPVFLTILKTNTFMVYNLILPMKYEPIRSD